MNIVSRACDVTSWFPSCPMIKIAREISESDSGVFAILEDVCCESDDKPQRRSTESQTEISCNDAPLATDVSIRVEDQQSTFEHPDVMFWRLVATQRANELDHIREDIMKEKETLDKKHDELYCQLQVILKNDRDDDDKSDLMVDKTVSLA
uniref:BMERB domain-containing protein n=1 Tax=Angiostrongylus cantonensis TaxID=6313 RepID=A0A0K0DBS0_ANGCA